MNPVDKYIISFFKSYIKLMRFLILPFILGGVAIFVLPHHPSIYKILIGYVIGFALQHHIMAPAVREFIEERFGDIFDDED